MKVSVALPSGPPLVSEVETEFADCGRELLAQVVASATEVLQNGSVEVDVQWTRVRLRASGGEVVAEEPDYAVDASRFTPSLSVTCRILELQRRVLQTVRTDGAPIRAEEYVRVSCNAMRSVSVVGYRHEDEPPFSGWHVDSAGSTADLADDKHGLYAVRELAPGRLPWIVAMVLPAGWSFRSVGGTLLEAVSPEGRTDELMISVDV